MRNIFRMRSVKNISYLVAENAFRLGVGFLVSILVARHLGPESFGHFNYVLSFIFLFIPLYTFGLDEIIVKDLVKSPESRSSILVNGFVLKLIGSLIAFFITLISVNIIEVGVEVKGAIILMSLWMFFRSIDVIDYWYQSKITIKKISFARTITFLIGSVLKLVLVFWKKDWRYFIYISCFEIVLIEVLYMVVYQSEFKVSIFKFSEVSLKKIKRYTGNAFPIILTLFLSNSLARVDQLMIGSMVGAEELGKYAVAVKLVDIWQFFPFAVINSLFPLVVSSFDKGKDEYRTITMKLYSILIWLSLGLCFGTYLFGENVVDLLYGDRFSGAGRLLTFYVWTTVFTFFLFIRTKVLTIENALRFGAWISLISLVMNIALNLYLIPLMGVEGAIIASLSSYFVGNLIVAFFSKEIRCHLIWYSKSIFFPIGLLISSFKNK